MVRRYSDFSFGSPEPPCVNMGKVGRGRGKPLAKAQQG